MKLKIVILFKLSFLALLIVGCTKDEDVQPTTGDLYNKPLPVIKASIQGRWQLHYGKGGIIANQIHDWGNDDYWEFDFSRSIDHINAYNDPITADTTITWIKGQDHYAGETYIMQFYDDKGNLPWNYTVLGVYNDTLVVKDFGSDPIFYYLTKH